ncbi:acyl-ACP thioesterase domain-containing protein [Secundilactobacillus kimchicus]|nr:acyl-ACP thioesterase domain-containing protein [Secundilactobacillus kimchicus]
MGASVYKQEHIITHYEVDVTSNLTPAMLMNVVLMVSEGQTEALALVKNT